MKFDLFKFIPKDKNPEKKKYYQSRHIGTFVVCVIISIIFWALTVLTKNYNSKIYFPVIYENLPEDKISSNKLPVAFAIDVNARGFDLLTYHLKTKVAPLYLNVHSSKYSNISTNYFLPEIKEQLGNELKVLTIFPDSIHFDFSERVTKKIPVKLNLLLTFEKQYGLSDSIKIIPDSVTISGTKSTVEKIDVIETEISRLPKLKESVTKKIRLEKNKNSVASFSNDEVQVTIPVEKFTEGNIEPPVETAHLPSGKKIKIIPEKVKVTYQVTLSNYDKVETNLFSAVVDFLDIKKDSDNKLKVDIIKFPGFIRSAKVIPDKVDYIIIK